MSLLGFLHATHHTRVTAPGGLGGECVDLVNLYLQDVCHMPLVRLNAVDWASVRIPGWEWTMNGPSNFPTIGAIVVWKTAPLVGIGSNGHVALAIHADSRDLLTYDQNWPPGGGCEFVSHSYLGVVGWHTPPVPVR